MKLTKFKKTKNFLKTIVLTSIIICFGSCSENEIVEEDILTETSTIKETLPAYSNKVAPIVGGKYTITSVSSGRTLDISSASNSNGANLQVWGTNSNTTATHRQWEIISTGGNYVRLKGVDSGKSLEVSGGSNANNANVQQWAYQGTTHQQWEIISVGNNEYRIKNRDSGKSLRIYGTTNGSNAAQYAYQGWNSQKFYFTEVGGTTTTPPTGNSPGSILSLTNNDWKLNGFTASPSSSATYYDDVMDQVNGNIATWENSNYFYDSNGWAYFKCYRGLGSSQNSNNPRVELRELNGSGGLASWNGDNGSHIMSFTVRVDQLPVGYDDDENEDRSTGTLCFAQIHGPSGTNSNGVDVDDTIRVQFEGSAGQSSGSVKMKISGYITEDQGGGSETIDGFSLDTSYDMQLRFINDRLSIVVNGNEVFGRTLNTAGNGSYFKIGNYLQSVQNAPYTGSFGLVGFKNLTVTHN